MDTIASDGPLIVSPVGFSVVIAVVSVEIKQTFLALDIALEVFA